MGHQHIELKKGMKVASMNVNGLRNHLDEIKLIIRSLYIHILALNETKLDYPREFTSIPGHHQERLDRTGHGGGVSVYIGDSIKYALHSDVPIDDMKSSSATKIDMVAFSKQNLRNLAFPMKMKFAWVSCLAFYISMKDDGSGNI